jgi:1,4-dihydroxy-6-naphthoate synthase
MKQMEIKVAHSPDADDAFMFYALAKDKVDTGELKFTHILQDIETLNRKAFEGEFDVTAVSFHAYSYLTDKYALLPSGASIGNKYGPILVSQKEFDVSELKNKLIAIPGTLTTAFLVLKLYSDGENFQYKVVPFDKILHYVKQGSFDAGLIIHEGQLTYKNIGLTKIADLGEWWYSKTELPLPLGGNVIKKSLGKELMLKISNLLRRSIEYGLEHREEALNYALKFSRDLKKDLTDKFVGMYVNDMTLNYSSKQRKALQLLLNMGYEKGIIKHKVKVEFIE